MRGRRHVGLGITAVLALVALAAPATASFRNDDAATATISTGSLAPATAPAAQPGSCLTLVSASIDVSWTPSANAGGYRVQVGTTAGGPYPTTVEVSGGSTSSATVSGLAFGTRYYAVVIAVRGGWTSGPTPEVTALTPSALCG